MDRFLDNYDLKKIKEAKRLVEEVLEYNNIEWRPEYKKLKTIQNKLQRFLEDEIKKRRL